MQERLEVGSHVFIIESKSSIMKDNGYSMDEDVPADVQRQRDVVETMTDKQKQVYSCLEILRNDNTVVPVKMCSAWLVDGRPGTVVDRPD